MSIGSGIALLVIGAILAFAIHIPIDWVDLNVIGYIMMVAGAVVFIIGIVLYVRRRGGRQPEERGGPDDRIVTF